MGVKSIRRWPGLSPGGIPVIRKFYLCVQIASNLSSSSLGGHSNTFIPAKQRRYKYGFPKHQTSLPLHHDDNVLSLSNTQAPMSHNAMLCACYSYAQWMVTGGASLELMQNVARGCDQYYQTPAPSTLATLHSTGHVSGMWNRYTYLKQILYFSIFHYLYLYIIVLEIDP